MSTFRLPIIIFLLLILQGCRQNPAADGGTWPHVNDTVDAIIARLDSISFTRADIPTDELAALDSMSDILPPGVLDFWHARAMRGSLSRDSATAILNRALKSADSASQPYIYHRLWSESLHLDDNPGIREVNGIHRCYEYFTSASDKKMSLATCISLGNIYLRMRLYSRSRTWMDRADSIADIVGLPLIKKKMRINRASLYMREEHLDSAEMILRPLVGDPEMTVDPPTYNTILRNLYICTNDYHILETARAALDTINGGENMKVAFEILTSTHFSNLNMPDSAAIYASRAFSHINDADNIELEEYIVLNKADACLYLGKTDSAAMLYSQYIALNDSADLVSKHETLTRMKEIADLAESEKAAVITRYRRIVGTMHDYLLFEGIVKQLKIAVSAIGRASDLQGGDSPERLGMGQPYGKPVWILPDVSVDRVKLAVRADNLVIEPFLKNLLLLREFINHNLENGKLTTENIVEPRFNRKKNMKMVGHEGILEQAEGGMNLR